MISHIFGIVKPSPNKNALTELNKKMTKPVYQSCQIVYVRNVSNSTEDKFLVKWISKKIFSQLDLPINTKR